MALDTVADMVAQARAITNDEVQPFRYADTDFVGALNAAIMESKRLRPDMWLFPILGSTTLPSIPTPPGYIASTDTTPVPVDPMYRMAFVYYMCGQAQLRDEEETQDARAAALMGMFYKQLLSLA